MSNSTTFKFFFADGWRIAILILIITAIILFLLVIIRTFSKPKKFKLIFIVMINVMATAILNSAGFLLNWVDENGKLLFGDEEGFFCQTESIVLFFSHTARETFVTLISVISFISFSFGDKFNLDNSKLSLIIVLLLGYLIPFIADIIYFNLKIFGQSHYFCFTRGSGDTVKIAKTCGSIHTYYVLFLVIVSASLIIYLVIATTFFSKEKINDAWANNENTKHCISPILKKIIFFPIAQILANCIALSYRIIDFNGTLNAQSLARPAAAISSISCISYTIIFAVTNGIFSDSKKEDILDNSEAKMVEL